MVAADSVSEGRISRKTPNPLLVESETVGELQENRSRLLALRVPRKVSFTESPDGSPAGKALGPAFAVLPSGGETGLGPLVRHLLVPGNTGRLVRPVLRFEDEDR